MSAIALELSSGWTLSGRTDGDQPTVIDIPANVPGCVHTDLLAVGLIPDPFVADNEPAVAWVADIEWRYRCEFTPTPEMLAQSHIDLEFEGLDTLATIRVNGAVIGETANMHRRYRYDITARVVPGANQLEIDFRSATRYCESLRESEGEWPSSSFGRPFNYLRKMACSWGWDWGPWLTTAGVWRPARVVAWSGARFGDPRPRALVDGDDNGSLSVEFETRGDTSRRIEVELRDPHGTIVGVSSATTEASTTQVELDAGCVERWWPHSHGAQPLYEMVAHLVDHDGMVCDTRRRQIGFRTIELDTTPDATGSAFTLSVNGVPIFARGVNWIPDDIFVTRITDDDYRQRLQQAIDANVDLIRVWGGGIYEDARFYEACDEFGLLVWQDFLFACAAYPEHLLADEVEAEVRDNVSRLMHHPSLAIWNGNNENLWGYSDWGWQDVLQGRSWGAGFYHELLPAICAELDPGRAYVPGSPWSGSTTVAPNADSQGCVHVWDVWNQLDLSRYRDHTPRFVAEFGWQAPASWATLAEVLPPDERSRHSPSMHIHQKAADGDLKIDRGIVPRFGEIEEFDAFWYAAQVVQARAVQTGIEHFRALRPYCMGTIWWQLNDCWPVVSWSVVDSDGRRKPAWYALRASYRPRLLTIQPRGDRLVAFAVNDGDEPWLVEAVARRLTFEGAELARVTLAAEVLPGSCASFLLDTAVAVADDPRREVLVIEAERCDPDHRAWWWFAADRELSLGMPDLDVEWAFDANGAVMSLTSDTVVRDLAIYPEQLVPTASTDRQLINLLPGVTERIRLDGLTQEHIDAVLARPACWHIASLLAR